MNLRSFRAASIQKNQKNQITQSNTTSTTTTYISYTITKKEKENEAEKQTIMQEEENLEILSNSHTQQRNNATTQRKSKKNTIDKE